MKTERLQAVVTTGIYCRASCAARPLPQNVRPVASPVAAEAAGFRPCLHCRSDRAVVEEHYVSDEVTRAVTLISEGFLDRHREADLARAVGYSARQLRRLFQEQVGATPDFVARSRRAHFARRLLDEARLTITEIAYASGFNSPRQMNRVVKEIFASFDTPTRVSRRCLASPSRHGRRLPVVPRSRAMSTARTLLSTRTHPSPVGALRLVASDVGLRAILWPDDQPGRVRFGPSRRALSGVG